MPMNFAEVLNNKVADIERPPLIPVGTYEAIVSKIPNIETSQDGKWDFVIFPVKLVAPQDDVDQDALKEFGGVTAAFTSRRFMFNKEDDAAFKRAEYDLRRFLEHLGLDIEGGMDLKEALNASVNQRFLAFMRWRADKNDPETQYSEIGRTAPIE